MNLSNLKMIFSLVLRLHISTILNQCPLNYLKLLVNIPFMLSIHIFFPPIIPRKPRLLFSKSISTLVFFYQKLISDLLIEHLPRTLPAIKVLKERAPQTTTKLFMVLILMLLLSHSILLPVISKIPSH